LANDDCSAKTRSARRRQRAVVSSRLQGQAWLRLIWGSLVPPLSTQSPWRCIMGFGTKPPICPQRARDPIGWLHGPLGSGWRAPTTGEAPPLISGWSRCRRRHGQAASHLPSRGSSLASSAARHVGLSVRKDGNPRRISHSAAIAKRTSSASDPTRVRFMMAARWLSTVR